LFASHAINMIEMAVDAHPKHGYHKHESADSFFAANDECSIASSATTIPISNTVRDVIFVAHVPFIIV
jgi:hypothetical protein